MMKPLVAKTIEIATSHIGKREIGRTNRGIEVDRWLRQAGVSPGNPWCAGFTYGNKEDAAAALDVENPFIRSAYTPDIFNWAKVRSILIPCISKGRINRPEPGDDFLVMGPVRIYHTGHVQKVMKDGFWKIEGNSNSEGSNEGYEVARNFTPFHSRYYFVRWSALVPDAQGNMLTRKLYLGGKLAHTKLPVRENVTYVPVRKWAAWMGNQKVEWIAGSDTPLRLNGRPLDSEIAFYPDEEGINRAHVPVRDLTALDPTLIVEFDAREQAVSITRARK